jgi:hypothetical protein
MTNTLTEAENRAITRAGAHAAAEMVLRPVQRFMYEVTDLQVARVMRALESGAEFTYCGGPSWMAPLGHPLDSPEWRRRLKRVIPEMIRTGLVRHYRTPLGGNHLIPSPVHARNLDDRNLSACLFVGEDRGPMRSRLVDDLLDVDCLACERAIATGKVRGL